MEGREMTTPEALPQESHAAPQRSDITRSRVPEAREQ
jgi:hypothetical protein